MRPDVDRYFTDMARLVASRSTCIRRSVGCVLVDQRNRVLATGYNGVAAGDTHCNEPIAESDDLVPQEKRPKRRVKFPHACAGARAKSGQALDTCRAVHAEQNAILQCADTDKVYRAYVTTFPCPNCAKLLLNTGCREIVFIEGYGDDAGFELWVRAGRVVRKFEGEPPMIQRDIVRLYGVDDPLNEWRVLIACVCLNLASARVARGIVMRILERWPDPDSLWKAPSEDLEGVLRPLGLSQKRTAYLHGLSVQWGTVAHASLPGVGSYAIESLMVFCWKQYPRHIGDRKVAAWVEWAKRNPEKV